MKSSCTIYIIGVLYAVCFPFISCESKENLVMENMIVIDFPLRGTWISPNTPGKKIPSHGISKYGETYAYDFVKVNSNTKNNEFYSVSLFHYLLHGAQLDECYGWGAEIYAPFEGEIVKVEDGLVERHPVHLKTDIQYMREVTSRFENGNAEYNEVAGNHLIIKYDENVYALLAHLKNGSIRVQENQLVKRGQILGEVGHSGNSTAPHLHFQLMENIDPMKSIGLPCGFAEYQEFKHGKWVMVEDGIPGRNRIRNIE